MGTDRMVMLYQIDEVIEMLQKHKAAHPLNDFYVSDEEIRAVLEDCSSFDPTKVYSTE
jgi:hypothetical protein